MKFRKKLREELLKTQGLLNRETYKCRIMQESYERSVAAHEQAGPLNREMRQFINSMQDRNRQLYHAKQRLLENNKHEEESKPSVEKISVKQEHDLNGEQSEVEKLKVALSEANNKLKLEEAKNKSLSVKLEAFNQLSEDDKNNVEERAGLQQKLQDLQEELQQKNVQLENWASVKKEKSEDMQTENDALKIKTLESECEELRGRLVKKRTEQEQLTKECESVGNAYDDMFEQLTKECESVGNA